MYVPAAFHEPDIVKLHDFIKQYSFGVLVSQLDGVPFATHLPFMLEPHSGPNGTLVGHTAKANPQCEAANGQTVLAIFSGPHAYVSPTWYEAENVVPTWNYVAVHATGKLQIIHETESLKAIVQNLTDAYERSMPTPWKFEDSSVFSERLLTQIVGFRIQIDVLEGKWKLSQNHPVARQERVARALQQQSGNSQAVATLMFDRLRQQAE